MLRVDVQENPQCLFCIGEFSKINLTDRFVIVGFRLCAGDGSPLEVGERFAEVSGSSQGMSERGCGREAVRLCFERLRVVGDGIFYAVYLQAGVSA